MAYIEVSPGLRLYYLASGSGDQTVIVPGAGWTDDFEALARGRRLVRYDPRGRGQSSAIALDQASFENDLADLDRVRESLGMARVALIGWSYFGGVVARYAMLHPERVERFVSVGGVPLWRAGWAEAIQRDYAQRLAALPPDVLRRQEEAQQSGDGPAQWRSMMEVFRATRMGRPPVRPLPEHLADCPNEWPANFMPRLMRAMETMGDWDWREDAAKLQVPALIVEGSADLVPEASREWAEVMPNARLFLLEGVGHFPSVEDPDHFFPALDEFLRGH